MALWASFPEVPETLTAIGHSTGVDGCMSRLARSAMKLMKSRAV
jgi:hypothetical protein